jgi:3-mercaptopyruvate sulfurtransferase SseA
MRILLSAVFLSSVPAIAIAATCGGHGDRGTMLVTPAWLAAHLTDPNLVVLAMGDPKEYAAAHIPGSVRLNCHPWQTWPKPSPARA